MSSNMKSTNENIKKVLDDQTKFNEILNKYIDQRYYSCVPITIFDGPPPVAHWRRSIATKLLRIALKFDPNLLDEYI